MTNAPERKKKVQKLLPAVPPECCFICDILNLYEKPQNNLVHTLKLDYFRNFKNLKINAVQADEHSLLHLE